MNQTPELLKLGQLFVAVVAVPGRCAFTRSGKPICVAYRPINGNSSKGERRGSERTCGVGDGGAEGGEVEGVLAVAHGCRG